MDISFKGKTALVTGAGQGIGCAIAIRLAECDARVYALSRTQKHLHGLLQEAGPLASRIETVCVDLDNWDTTRQAVQALGRIDVLINNAAVAELASFLEVTPESFDRLFNVNVKAVINVSQIVAQGMKDRGLPAAIVNLSSQAGKAALKDHTVYCGTKGALEMVSAVMALELGQYGIRTNCVCPTVVLTDMGRLGWSEPAKASDMLSKIPLKRFAEVSEVVDAVVYLASDRASMINGVCLPVDGGFLAC